MKTPNILIMTATITPPADVPFLARTDPNVRIKDYEAALRFYISLLGRVLDAIVFVDNSNSDISTLQAIAQQSGVAEKVEFVVFNGLDYPSNYGRAYGEFKLLDYAMAQSQIIQQQSESAKIWKVTGRYRIKNLRQIIQRQPQNTDFYCNVRKLPKPWVDLYLLAWTQKGYTTCLKGIYPQLRTQYAIAEAHPEEMFVDLLGHFPKNVVVAQRICPSPQIIGVKGADNKNYLAGRNLFKFYLRSLGQKIAPWLWI